MAMATITEDYVSFEIAKLLKEKGFDGECNRVYQGPNLKYTTIPISPLMSLGEFGGFHPKRLYVNNNELGDIAYTAPTLQMAMKWLREVHGLHISVDACPIYGKVKDEKGKNTCGLLYWHYMASGEWINDKYNPQQKAFVVSEKSYKKAIEAALKYSLENLI